MKKKKRLRNVKKAPKKKINKHLANFVKFAMWLALPSDNRVPDTHVEFAKSLNITHKTLCEWKKMDDLWELRDKFMAVWSRAGTPDVIKGMLEGSKKSDAKCAQLYLKYVEKWTDKIEVGRKKQVII